MLKVKRFSAIAAVGVAVVIAVMLLRNRDSPWTRRARCMAESPEC